VFFFTVEESIVNAPQDYSDQLFKSNLTFCVFLISSLKNQSVFKTSSSLAVY
jgi:hypothetical protein